MPSIKLVMWFLRKFNVTALKTGTLLNKNLKDVLCKHYTVYSDTM